MRSLTTPTLVEAARTYINEVFTTNLEWFVIAGEEHTQSVRRNEFDVTTSHGSLVFSCWTEKGTRTWRIDGWQWTGDKLLFDASRRMGAERLLIEMVPRASATAIAATVKAARQKRAEQLAQLASSLLTASRVERSSLSPGIRRGQPGRYARILLRLRHQRIAVTASVIPCTSGEVDAFLASALLWFRRTSGRIKPPFVQQLWLIIERKLVKPLTQRIALLRPGLKTAISIFEIDDFWTELKLVPYPELSELWRQRLARFPPAAETPFTELSLSIEALAPESIDIVRARFGETLRFFGLPFARVRRVLGIERLWFGIEGSRRRLLEAATDREWRTLMADLRTYRSASSTDRHHSLYRMAAEAWLESLLRRDITKLDPGLIIAPLHAQFRTTRGTAHGVRPIDLLALRRDGRLVVIELKVTEDREHVLQGADYWQRVEAHRRRGHISRAHLFGPQTIRDEPPLVYLVAPTLRVHPALLTLGPAITSEIEIYRFDINEDWRTGVRVMRRMRIN